MVAHTLELELSRNVGEKKRGTFGSFIHSALSTVRSPVTGDQFQFKLLKDLVHKPHLHAERRILADLST